MKKVLTFLLGIIILACMTTAAIPQMLPGMREVLPKTMIHTQYTPSFGQSLVDAALSGKASVREASNYIQYVDDTGFTHMISIYLLPVTVVSSLLAIGLGKFKKNISE